MSRFEPIQMIKWLGLIRLIEWTTLPWLIHITASSTLVLSPLRIVQKPRVLVIKMSSPSRRTRRPATFHLPKSWTYLQTVGTTSVFCLFRSPISRIYWRCRSIISIQTSKGRSAHMHLPGNFDLTCRAELEECRWSLKGGNKKKKGTFFFKSRF